MTLRPVDTAVLRTLSDVWETAFEIRVSVRQHGGDFTPGQIHGALRRLRALGLADSRPPWEGLRVSEWAITPEGDAAAEAT